MNNALETWVNETAAHTTPDRIHWVDGSAQENDRLIAEMLASGTTTRAAYDGALKNLRALGALYPETVQLVVRADSGINSVRDLKGKSVSSGAPGSGQYQLVTDLLKAYGLSRNDIKEDLSSFTQAMDKIKDGNLHATLITAGVPVAASRARAARTRREAE